MLKVRNLSLNSTELENGLADVSFQAEKGSVTILLGNNGSGKSTLLSAIGEAEPNFTGEIIANHYNLRNDPERAKLLISFSPQQLELPAQLTALEYLELIASAYNLPGEKRKNRAIQLIQSFNLGVVANSTVERLSPSQLKKLSLAAAFLADAPILLLDEPTLFLDHPSILKLAGMLEYIGESSATVIATNNLEFAQDVGDRFVLLKNGAVAADGTLTELANQAQSRKLLTDIYLKILGEE